jgi:hypothetical protein
VGSSCRGTIPTATSTASSKSILPVCSWRYLRARGCPKINLHIRSTNGDAVAFYAALGFTHDPVLSMGKRLVDDE